MSSDELTDGIFVIKSNVGVSYATQKSDEKNVTKEGSFTIPTLHLDPTLLTLL